MYVIASRIVSFLLTFAYASDGQKSCELLQSLKSVNLPSVPKGTPFAKPGVRFESYEGMGHSLGDKVSRKQQLRILEDFITDAFVCRKSVI